MNDISVIKPKNKELNSLRAKFGLLKAGVQEGNCFVCNMAQKMDDETRASFIDVFFSKVTQMSIVEALSSEGFMISKTTLGDARRKCFNDQKKNTCGLK